VSSLSIAAGLLGGVGLFLLGMRLLSDGLKLAAGDSLKRILATGTRTPARALLAGGLVTALVQSSSAVTVATIGFVNAGVLDLARAVVVVFGSNVGTTMTAWIVALLGVRFHVGAVAVPLVGVGALLHLIGRGSRRSALGDAVAGFGLFLLGIDVLRGSFESLGEAVDVAALDGSGAAGIAVFVAIGFVMTTLTQSSSAALTLTLTAAAGGVISLAAAAAGAIGTNLGTTSTAALAVIGATSNARRVAAAHVIFNGVAAAVALATLPLLLAGVGALRRAFDLEDTPATALALFHTSFNLLGVALIWPWRRRLIGFLEGRFRSREEQEGTPRFLDRNVADTPDLALAALGEELARTRAIAHDMARAALAPNGAPSPELAARRQALAELLAAVARFAARLGSRDLPDELAERLAVALQVARHQREAADRALELIALRGAAVEAAEPRRAIEDLERGLARLLDTADTEPYPAEAARAARQAVDLAYEPLKAQLLLAATRGQMPVDRLSDQLDRIRAVRRLAEQVEEGARHLGRLHGPREADAPDPS
jgi:phosphate:Na+ symporter